ncbi:flavodoxin [Selenomonas sp.]|uniref:flavodoxin n=1 Tax=Selenomonas sp. TaxID=2053611 RepID=UPI0025D42DE1|nr:flavodoxin [Selenomonas sp.]MCI6284161.1 NAD(P)H-dependent oxidoreductase [Selenomonas sp.]
MKKMFTLVLASLMMLVLGGCGSDSAAATTSSKASTTTSAKAATPASSSSTGTNAKALVVYFSATGNTKALAQTAAEALGADTFEIVPEKVYTKEDLNYNDETTRATVEMKDESARPAIKNKLEGLEKYETIVIAYPIWWGQAPRIIDTFMESYDLNGKTIVPICTSSSSDIGSSGDYLHQFAPNATWKDGKRFEKNASASELKSFFAGLGLVK